MAIEASKGLSMLWEGHIFCIRPFEVARLGGKKTTVLGHFQSNFYTEARQLRKLDREEQASIAHNNSIATL
eukprot:6212873-Pleurochrysis_carterae.AAC.1